MNGYTTRDYYEALARHLDESPLGAPKTGELLDLLKALFEEKEAFCASLLPFKPTSLLKLAELTGMESEELRNTLLSLSKRGLCFHKSSKKDDYFSMLPLIPGLSETQFMSGIISPEKRRLARLFRDYYEGGTAKALLNADLPIGRVIPVGRSLENNQGILPYERAENVIKGQAAIAVANCYCRQEAELLGEGCGHPKEVCLIFGPFALYLERQGIARAIDEDEALSVLDTAEKAGLVHVTDNVTGPTNFMCNCCGCCCLFLRTITRLEKPGAIAQAAFLARVDEDQCISCQECIEHCQVSAISCPEGLPAKVDPERCLGCGHCAGHCPQDAITFKRRKIPDPPATWPELNATLLKARFSPDQMPQRD